MMATDTFYSLTKTRASVKKKVKVNFMFALDRNVPGPSKIDVFLVPIQGYCHQEQWFEFSKMKDIA